MFTCGANRCSRLFPPHASPPSLRGFFASPAIEARHLGITQLNGMPVSPGDMIVPRCCTLPMGFAWSLYFAQRAHEHVLEQGSILYWEENRLRDRTSFREVENEDIYDLQYVDNLVVRERQNACQYHEGHREGVSESCRAHHARARGFRGKTYGIVGSCASSQSTIHTLKAS